MNSWLQCILQEHLKHTIDFLSCVTFILSLVTIAHVKWEELGLRLKLNVDLKQIEAECGSLQAEHGSYLYLC